MRLKNEIWGCKKYIGFSMEEIMDMPIMDRKVYISLHNKEQKKKKADYDAKAASMRMKRR